MELFKIEELEQVSPLFRGKAGHGLARGIFKALGISRIQEGYDRNDCYEGPEFASHILEEFGVRYSVEGPSSLSATTLMAALTVWPWSTYSGISDLTSRLWSTRCWEG